MQRFEIQGPGWGILLVLGVCALAGLGSGQVIINEVHCGIPDYVELWNLASGSVDVSGWQLETYSGTNLDPDPGTFVLPQGTVIGGRDFLVIRELGTPGGSPAPGVITTGQNFAFNDAEAIEVVLRNPQGFGRDYVVRRFATQLFTPHLPGSTGWIGVLGGQGESIIRVRERDSNLAQDWIVLPSSPTEGAPNPGQHGDATPFGRVMITEVSWGDPDALEITNFSFNAVDLTGWRVKWKDTSLVSTPPIGLTLASGQSMIVTETSFVPSLPGVPVLAILPQVTTTGNAFSVALEDQDGIVVDEVRIRSTTGTLPPTDLGGFFTGAVARTPENGLSPIASVERHWGIDSDTAEDWTEQGSRTLGRENTSSGPLGVASPFDPGLRISEISRNPDCIEIHNAGTVSRDMEKAFLLFVNGQGAAPVAIRPFVTRTELPAGGHLVLGEGPKPPEIPSSVTYIDLLGLGQLIPLTDLEFSCALYDLRGRQLDVVRATRPDSLLVHNDPRTPGPNLAFTGAALRIGGATDVIARIDASLDTNSGADWRATLVRTMGLPNTGFTGLLGKDSPLDARLNATGQRRGLAFILNGGAGRQGLLHHLAYSAGHAQGRGPIMGLGPDAVQNFLDLLGVPPFSGVLDATGASRFDLSPGSLPPGIALDVIWILQDPVSGALVGTTPVLQFDS